MQGGFSPAPHHRPTIQRKPGNFLPCPIRSFFILKTNKRLTSHADIVMCDDGWKRFVGFKEVEEGLFEV